MVGSPNVTSLPQEAHGKCAEFYMTTEDLKKREEAARRREALVARAQQPDNAQALDWIAKISRLAICVENCGTAANNAAWNLQEAIRLAPPGVLAGGILPPGAVKPDAVEPFLRKLGVSRGLDENYRFYLDSNPKPLSLSPQISKLMLFLAGIETEREERAPASAKRTLIGETPLGMPAPRSAMPAAAEEAVPWRSRQQVREFLQTTTKTPVKPSFVSTIVGKLKDSLTAHDGRTLIFSGPKGYRLALLKGGVYRMM